MSLVIRIRPGSAEQVRARLVAIPGVEVHATTPDGGRLIVTVEDGEHHATADSLLAAAQTQGVLGVTLAYEFAGDAEAVS